MSRKLNGKNKIVETIVEPVQVIEPTKQDDAASSEEHRKKLYREWYIEAKKNKTQCVCGHSYTSVIGKASHLASKQHMRAIEKNNLESTINNLSTENEHLRRTIESLQLEMSQFHKKPRKRTTD